MQESSDFVLICASSSPIDESTKTILFHIRYAGKSQCLLGNLSGIGKLKAMTLKVTVTLMVVLESLKIFHLLYNVVLLKLNLGILKLD